MSKRLSAPALFAAALLLGSGIIPARAAGVVSICDETHLRAALAGGGLVAFGCSGDIGLLNTLTISMNTSIDGTGYTVTLDGQNNVQVLTVKSGVTLSLNNLTIANGGGGVYVNLGTLIVTSSTFLGNSANYGGAIYNNDGNVAITNSTFSSNSAATDGGGIYNSQGKLSLTNTTFSANSAAAHGGGIANVEGTLIATSSTFSGNSAYAGGGISNVGGLSTLEDTIVAKSTNGGDCEYESNMVTDGGYNLDDDGSCGFSSANHSLSNDKNANLGSLSSNGGPTQTIPLQSPSDAIGVIPADTNGCATSLIADQRGVGRPGSLNGNCSIGAFEYVPAPASTITDCTNVSTIESDIQAGGRIVIQCSGDIQLTGTLTISSNTAIDATGYNVTLDGQHKYQVLNHGSGVLILNNLTVANGVASAIYNNGLLVVTDSTVSSSTGGTGGGLSNDGSGTAIIANSTFTGNSAEAGGGLVNYGGMTLVNSTISGNSASQFGGGFYQDGFATVENTILANNTGGDCGRGGGVLADGGFNLDDDGSCGLSSTNHSFSDDKNVNLGTLSNNGGSTETVPFTAASDAIDAIPLGVNGCGMSADQRGVFRPQGPACDIGAFETTQYLLTTAANPSADGTVSPASGTYYLPNTVVNLKATPKLGYLFTNWTGNVANQSSASTTVKMTGPQSVTANFAVGVQLTLKVSPSGTGTVSPASGLYAKGSVVKITAMPNRGYTFVRWTGNVANPNSASTTVTMNQAQTVTAYFLF